MKHTVKRLMALLLAILLALPAFAEESEDGSWRSVTIRPQT